MECSQVHPQKVLSGNDCNSGAWYLFPSTSRFRNWSVTNQISIIWKLLILKLGRVLSESMSPCPAPWKLRSQTTRNEFLSLFSDRKAQKLPEMTGQRHPKQSPLKCSFLRSSILGKGPFSTCWIHARELACRRRTQGQLKNVGSLLEINIHNPKHKVITPLPAAYFFQAFWAFCSKSQGYFSATFTFCGTFPQFCLTWVGHRK